MKLQLLLTGDELLTGDVVDTNSCWLADRLKEQGININRKTTVGDDLTTLVNELTNLSQQCDVLIVNGGLGPTIDDLTAEALSLASGQPLKQHPQAVAHLEQWFQKRTIELNSANLKQALLPADVNLIHNPTGTAPGFSSIINDCLIICTPGVPSELKRMYDDSIADTLNILQQGDCYSTERMLVFGIGEAELQQLISDNLPDWPPALNLGFRAQMPTLELKVSGSDPALKQVWLDKLKQLLGDNIVGPGDSNLALEVIKQLSQQGKTVATAESCTGGMIGAQITSNAGSSAAYSHGFITYSNQAKQDMLAVSADTLEQYGAVSEQVVQEMARGALSVSGSDLAVAVSGVAGPDGGSDDKPVGTVWIAWGNSEKIKTKKLFLPASRYYFQNIICSVCLDLIRRELIGSEQRPNYFNRYQAK
ncbi:Nicotinamide-nucleotide amidohydrolase PncC [Sinobacterium norvegicum]|uniref:CinA-like protein n=1 Tax=Sinobacterium norvegicum TaxID=1641715 RepID=A0ABN8EDX8_9GAMM|nr:CinA family nicotinamide mononucleotide deamidase-related protein [Sinobacterium norvegicum]CAH0990651.1 Nicotinamide-nucleotide amidohydrolase PncC [Sinobacterium norvegicum]